jgi:hypothetical protein
MAQEEGTIHVRRDRDVGASAVARKSSSSNEASRE